MMLTLCGLIYQVQIIYYQYMSGKTVVSLEIGRLPDDSPPGITICYSGLFSMERAAKNRRGYFEINDIYKSLLRNRSNDKFKFYLDSFFTYSYDIVGSHHGFNLNELFDKISIKYKALDGSLSILLYFYGNMENKTQHGHIKAPYDEYKYNSIPLETISTVPPPGYKCMTFYSSAQNEWRKFLAQLKLIKIHMNTKIIERSFPYNRYYYISLHSTNQLPESYLGHSKLGDFRKIDTKKAIPPNLLLIKKFWI